MNNPPHQLFSAVFQLEVGEMQKLNPAVFAQLVHISEERNDGVSFYLSDCFRQQMQTGYDFDLQLDFDDILGSYDPYQYQWMNLF